MKRHLLKARGSSPQFNRAACGMRGPPQFTTDPDRVTCLACRGTLFMADYLFRRTQRPTSRAARNEKRSNE